MTRPKHKVTSLEEAEQHLKDVTSALDKARIAEPDNDHIGLVREKRLAQNMVGRLRGDMARLNEQAILKTPQFRRVLQVILTALEPFPEASKAMEKALLEYDVRKEKL